MSGNQSTCGFARRKGTFTSRREFLVSSIATAGSLVLYSTQVARHEISIITQELAVNDLPLPFYGFQIVQISDIHFDAFTDPSFIQSVIAHVNSLRPDLVILPGDYISVSRSQRPISVLYMERCAEALRDLAPTQCFAVMGNHDWSLGPATIGSILATAGITLLYNQYQPIERNGERLWLCGSNDPVSGVPDLGLTIPDRPDGPVLLMCHGPDYADTVITHRSGRLVDVMFAGHSHGGQVRLPYLGSIYVPRGGRKYVEGKFELGGLQLYVNRGIGTFGLPLRLNCPPEITLFTLRPAINRGF